LQINFNSPLAANLIDKVTPIK